MYFKFEVQSQLELNLVQLSPSLIIIIDTSFECALLETDVQISVPYFFWTKRAPENKLKFAGGNQLSKFLFALESPAHINFAKGTHPLNIYMILYHEVVRYYKSILGGWTV